VNTAFFKKVNYLETYKDQLFEINYPEVKEMLQVNFEHSITSIQYEVTEKKVAMPGLCGEYVIPRIFLSFNDGTTNSILLFARRQLNSRESKQAHHYKYLSELGIPVPKLYGMKYDARGCEIMLLSYEKEIADEMTFFSSEENIKKFIDLSAKLSSVTLPMEYISLIGRDMAGKNDTRDWKTWMPWAMYILDRIWNLARKGDLNKDLEKLCNSDLIKTDLQRIALVLIRRINSFEIGISHSDFRPNNMVLLADNQLGLIDFEDVIMDARYYDIARYLGAPVSLFTWDERLREDYLAYFVKRNDLYGGQKLDLPAFKQELFQIWYTRTLNLWEWLPNEFGGPDYDFTPAGKNKDERCENLYRQLSALVENRKKIAQAISA
jgi:tRNA A-37 threonylcarbamoyl transferase component Bud32